MEKTNRSVFIRDALEFKCDFLQHVHAGGAYLPAKSPALEGFTVEQEEKIRVILEKAEKDLHKAAGPKAAELISGLVDYTRRSFNKSPGQRAMLTAQALIDQEFENRLLVEPEWSE